MLRLLTFLSTYRDAILFLILEAIAFSFIVRTNDPQRHRMGDALLEASGGMYRTRKDVVEYFALRNQNRILLAVNDSLYKVYQAQEARLETLRAQLGTDSLAQARVDSLLSQSPDTFQFIPARVIRNSTHRSYNYLTLDQGEDAGIEVDMGVIAPNGVVGRVIKTSKEYSLIQSAINLEFELAVKVVREATSKAGNLGFYKWDERDIRYGRVTYIPETANLQDGNLVLTAGSSTIFPPGFLLGTLAEENPLPSEGFYDVTMKLAVDFSSLNHVFVVNAPHKARQDSLETNITIE